MENAATTARLGGWINWKHSHNRGRREEVRCSMQVSQSHPSCANSCPGGTAVCIPCTGFGVLRVKGDKKQCQVCGIRPTKRLGVARRRFEVENQQTTRRRCSACASEGRHHRGSCKHFRTCGGRNTVTAVKSSMLIAPSDEEDAWQRAVTPLGALTGPVEGGLRDRF